MQTHKRLQPVRFIVVLFCFMPSRVAFSLDPPSTYKCTTYTLVAGCVSHVERPPSYLSIRSRVMRRVWHLRYVTSRCTSFVQSRNASQHHYPTHTHRHTSHPLLQQQRPCPPFSTVLVAPLHLCVHSEGFLHLACRSAPFQRARRSTSPARSRLARSSPSPSPCSAVACTAAGGEAGGGRVTPTT